jgi:chromosome segregation ATPase
MVKKKTKKKTTRKPVRRRTTKRTSTTKTRPAAGRQPGGTSVDALLKRFAKDRAAKESQLNALRKKREEIEAKAARLREQIAKLADQENKTQQELAAMDARRDREVSQLLGKLGVQLREASQHHTARDSHPQQLSDGSKTARDRVTNALAQRRGESN